MQLTLRRPFPFSVNALAPEFFAARRPVTPASAFVTPVAAFTGARYGQCHLPSSTQRRYQASATTSLHSKCSETSAHSEDVFSSSDPQANLKAHLISDAKADTSHFMLESHRPIDSTISGSTHSPAAAVTCYTNEAQHVLPHPIWSQEAMNGIRVTHCRPEKLVDKLAYGSVKAMRSAFDVLSGYALGRIDERGWLNRIVFLETVAGVPGMVGAMVRHLNSLRRMERDYGWIHTLLEEAENERMHLMTALVLRKPSYLFRVGVLFTQGLFLTAFTFSYILSRRFSHRFVGYLEEEAVITYTKLLLEMDNGHLPLFENLPAPPVARDYWRLHDAATFRDVILAIRADESHHRDVNHTFAGMRTDSPNPFPPGH